MDEDLREDLDTILTFIGSTSLTDEEAEIAEGMIDDENNKEEVYNALLAVLDSREQVSTMRQRLRYFYLAQGVTFAQDGDSPFKVKSNILIGSVL